MRKTLTAAAASAALIVGGLGWSSAASAADQTTVHESDVQTSFVGESGNVEWLSHSVFVEADNYDYAEGMYPVGKNFRDLFHTGTITQDWRGTGQPGVRLELNLGEDGTPVGGPDGVLTWESVYGGKLWLSPASTDAMKNLAPHTAVGEGNNDGQGSKWYGTLEEWLDATTSGTEVSRAGFGLGVPGEGRLKSHTFGESTYLFAKDEPTPKAKPYVNLLTPNDVRTTKRAVRLHITASQPDGTEPTKRGAYYKVVVHNPRTDKTRFAGSGRVKAENSDRVKVFPSAHLPKAKKALRVQVYEAGGMTKAHRMANVRFVPSKASRHGWDRHGWDRLK